MIRQEVVYWAEQFVNQQCKWNDIPPWLMWDVKELIDKLWSSPIPITNKSFHWDSDKQELIPDSPPPPPVNDIEKSLVEGNWYVWTYRGVDGKVRRVEGKFMGPCINSMLEHCFPGKAWFLWLVSDWYKDQSKPHAFPLPFEAGITLNAVQIPEPDWAKETS